MLQTEFINFAKSNIEKGQQELADVIRALLYKSAPTLFDLIDFYNDEIFLEPLLFVYFNTSQPQIKLEQILLGYIEDDLKPGAINVYANADGIIYLPRIGYFFTNFADRNLVLECHGDSETYRLTDDAGSVTHEFKRLSRVKGTLIDVLQFDCPLLKSFYRDKRGELVDVEVSNITRRHLGHLNTGFEIIKGCLPDYYDNILAVIKGLVIFNSECLNSFAALSAHGLAFFNAHEEDDELFFVEDILHQCGHVIFSALTFDKESYFNIDPDTPLRQFTGVDEESRTVYVTFHGVFTEAAMAQCLNICEENNVFTGRQRHELLGRLAFILKRFDVDLKNLDHHMFSEKGLFLYHNFKQVFEEIYRQRKSLISRLDTSNQPYNFSYRKFIELNPSQCY